MNLFTKSILHVMIVGSFSILIYPNQGEEKKSTVEQTDTLELYAAGLIRPIGIEIDSQDWLWIAEQGTGNKDSKISVITADNLVYPFLTGLPSLPFGGFPTGAQHAYFDIDGKLLIVQGEGNGTDSLSESILVVDTAGFTPGDPPLGIDDIEAYYNIGEFSWDQGAASVNPYKIRTGPDDDWFIVESGLNAIVRRERLTGDLSVFAQWSNVVPTGIVYTGDKFYVSVFSAYPYPAGKAKIYELDLSGNYTVYRDGLTQVVDIALDPEDNNIVFLEFARFTPNLPQADNTGGIYKINNGVIDTVVYPLKFPTGLRFNSIGDLFVCTFFEGNVYKVVPTLTDIKTTETIPEAFQLYQNYPNPFNPSTSIQYAVSSMQLVTLKVYDLLGREVATLVNEEKHPGEYRIEFDASGLSGGIYFYQLKVGSKFIDTKKLVLLK